jgi:selenocysteine lyase/cysteine desulfurase
MNIDKSPTSFPIKNQYNFLAHCSVSHLFQPAAEVAKHCLDRQVLAGRQMLAEYGGENNIARKFYNNFAKLMKTSADNITMTTNTSEAICMIANGYPWQPGDQIISYVNEYPANHYPWVVQTKRHDVELIQLSDCDVPQIDHPKAASIPDSFARGWSFEELESKVTDRTRVIAISHVQFTSGFAADLVRLGDFCRDKGIDLVVDAAQSMGCLPVYPEDWNAAAVASAGWKWMLGPVGTGVMYTRPDFREKIAITMTGADHMKQDTAYLDHRWNPHTTGQKFQYSTASYALLDGLSHGCDRLFNAQPMEEVRDHNFGLQDMFIEQLSADLYQPILHLPEHRSGILSLIPKKQSAAEVCLAMESQDIIVTPRDGYIRVAPHICTTEQEVAAAIDAFNGIG